MRTEGPQAICIQVRSTQRAGHSMASLSMAHPDTSFCSLISLCMRLFPCRRRRRTVLNGTRQASKGSAGQGRGDKPERLKDTLQTALSSVWGVSSSGSSNSSGGNGSVRAPRKPKRENQSRRASGTVRQRTGQGQSRAGRAETGPGRAQASKPAAAKGRFYWNITGFPFPLGPLLKRRTIRYEVRSSTPCMAVAV